MLAWIRQVVHAQCPGPTGLRAERPCSGAHPAAKFREPASVRGGIPLLAAHHVVRPIWIHALWTHKVGIGEAIGSGDFHEQDNGDECDEGNEGPPPDAWPSHPVVRIGLVRSGAHGDAIDVVTSRT